MLGLFVSKLVRTLTITIWVSPVAIAPLIGIIAVTGMPQQKAETVILAVSWLGAMMFNAFAWGRLYEFAKEVSYHPKRWVKALAISVVAVYLLGMMLHLSGYQLGGWIWVLVSLPAEAILLILAFSITAALILAGVFYLMVFIANKVLFPMYQSAFELRSGYEGMG